MHPDNKITSEVGHNILLAALSGPNPDDELANDDGWPNLDDTPTGDWFDDVLYDQYLDAMVYHQERDDALELIADTSATFDARAKRDWDLPTAHEWEDWRDLLTDIYHALANRG